MRERVLFVDGERWAEEAPTAPEFDCEGCGVCCSGSPKVTGDDLLVVPPGLVLIAEGKAPRMKTVEVGGSHIEGRIVQAEGSIYVHLFRRVSRRCAAQSGAECTLHGEYGVTDVDRRPVWCGDNFPVGAWGCQASRYRAGLPVSPWFTEEVRAIEAAVKAGSSMKWFKE